MYEVCVYNSWFFGEGLWFFCVVWKLVSDLGRLEIMKKIGEVEKLDIEKRLDVEWDNSLFILVC